MYIALVLAQTLVLPLLFAVGQLVLFSGEPLIVVGVWWAFWGVGTRLTVAGISQLVNPGRTSRGILGIDDAGAEQVVHELGFANLSMGVVALFAAFVPGWGILGALPGALYLGLAGVRHIAKRGKKTEETVATWTDLLVFVVVVVAIVGSAIIGR
ncbi:hypothetical protein [Glaciibacter flavus]|uniref:hypothetical protein n=1 Tax=Orlajensenia flava TaxID=2565934 RepID=UPI003AFF6EDE